ncbi:MAG TPA: hypothetical protein VFG60_05290, partial [Burkholderiaceae bacterium]|nr:hypothetical protein [Burkholderiaceae bacterium]
MHRPLNKRAREHFAAIDRNGDGRPTTTTEGVTMLCSIKKLDDFDLAARDGEVGHVRGAYFDDEQWVIRHVVVRTGGWLSHRDVLISPHSIETLDRGRSLLVSNLSRQQIEEAPGIDTDKPVSRQ